MFKDTLQALIAQSGCQKKTIAYVLNYNPSLLSKWLNGSSLPAQDKATRIIMKLAQFFTDEIADQEFRRNLCGYGDETDMIITNDRFNRHIFDLLSKSYWASLNSQHQAEEAKNQIVFRLNAYVSEHLENMLEELSLHIVQNVDYTKKPIIRITANHFQKHSWHKITNYLEGDAKDNPMPSALDVLIYLSPHDITFQELSDVISFGCLIKNVNPASEIHVCFLATTSKQPFIHFDDYGTIIEQQLSNKKFYTFIDNGHMPTDAMIERSEVSKTYLLESTPSLPGELSTIMKSQHMLMINFSLGLAILAGLPSLPNPHLYPADQALAIGHITSALRSIFKEKTFFLSFLQEEFDLLFEQRQLKLCNYTIKLSDEQILQAFNTLYRLSDHAGEQVIYLRQFKANDHAKHVMCIGSQNELYFQCHRLESKKPGHQSVLILKEDENTKEVYKSLCAQVNNLSRLSLKPKEFWKLMENTFKGRYM